MDVDSVYDAIVSGDIIKSRFLKYFNDPTKPFMNKSTEKIKWQIKFKHIKIQVVAVNNNSDDVIRIIDRINKNLRISLTPQRWKQFLFYFDEFLNTKGDLFYTVGGPVTCGAYTNKKKQRTIFIGHFAHRKLNICLKVIEKLARYYIDVINRYIVDYEKVELCIESNDHSNQMGALSCSECNFFHHEDYLL